MFWKKEKQINIKTYDYYVLSGDVQDGFWLNLHYSENEEDPFFLDICKEIILKVLSNKATILSFEILKDQEEVTIINHLEGKDCSNNNYILKEDQITIKKKALDYTLIEKYLNGATSRHRQYRSPRRFSLYGCQNEAVFEESILDLDEKNEKGLYDIFILYEEPPQSLEFEIKSGQMKRNELFNLIISICSKYGKKVNFVLEN